MWRENRAPLVDSDGNPTIVAIVAADEEEENEVDDDEVETQQHSSSVQQQQQRHQQHDNADDDHPSPSSASSNTNQNNHHDHDDHDLRRLVVTAATTAATLGYDVGIMAAAIQPIESEFHLNSWKKELAMGSLNFVAAVGALVGGRVANVYGRKPTITLACVLFVIGTICMTISPNYITLLVGRIVTGLGVGVAVIVTPVFLTEVAPTNKRGQINTIFDVAINVGILLGYVVGFCVEVSPLAEKYKWRLMLGLGVVLPLIILRSMALLPESPRWLVMANQPEAARHVLEHLGQSTQESHKTIHAIQQELDMEREEEEEDDNNNNSDNVIVRYCRFLCHPGPRLAMGMGIWQQITGTEAVLYYSADFLAMAGLDSAVRRLLGNVCVGVSKLIPELLAMQCVDRVGRRPLMVGSAIGLALALLCLSLAFYVPTSPIVVVVLLCAVMAAYSAGIGPFSFLVASENLGLTERADGMTACAAANRCTSGLVALSTVSLYEALGDAGFFALYALIGTISILFYYCCVPETTGLSLEELAARNRGTTTTSSSSVRLVEEDPLHHHEDNDDSSTNKGGGGGGGGGGCTSGGGGGLACRPHMAEIQLS